MTENEKTEPPHHLDWVSDFMRTIQREYMFYDKRYDEFHPVVFSEGTYIMNQGEPDEETRHYQEVCLYDGEQLTTIGDDHVYHKISEALDAFNELLTKIPQKGLTEMKIYRFRHPEHDWGGACTIEPSVNRNRLGFGIFVKKELLEGTPFKIREYPPESHSGRYNEPNEITDALDDIVAYLNKYREKTGIKMSIETDDAFPEAVMLTVTLPRDPAIFEDDDE